MIDKDKRRRVCPTCKKRRTMVAFFYEWYGATVVCLACGERWNDGEQEERPFMPGWRKNSIARARKQFAEPVPPHLRERR